MMRLNYSDLIKVINQMSNQQSENEFMNRVEILNRFALPYALLHNVSPLIDKTDNKKGKFEIDNTSNTLTIYFEEQLKLKILPDTQTHCDYDNFTLLLVIDVPNKNIVLYLPRVNNYEKFFKTNCENISECNEDLKHLDTMLKQLIEETPEGNKTHEVKQLMALQLQAENIASKKYNQSSPNRDFCKILIQQVNLLLKNNDERFINFISGVIADNAGLHERTKQAVRDIISNALSNQDNDICYRLLALSENDFKEEIGKLPFFNSPATLEKDERVVSYIDTSRQIEFNEENYVSKEDTDKKKIKAVETKKNKPKEKTAGDVFFDTFNNNNTQIEDTGKENDIDLFN